VDINRDDDGLLKALRSRDEQVFTDLVERWGGIMLRLALAHIENRAVAEEVVQEAWLIMLRSLDRFEGRSSFRTWLLGIVVNLARSRGRAERRLTQMPLDADGPSVDPARFLPANHARWPHHWAGEPLPWPTPEEDLLAGEIRGLILKTIDTLPASQREVLVLRDLEGLSATEVCNVLGLADTYQRVLLHRARSRVRLAMEQYFIPTETT
jgi:RNA polymerase sigma-70 factor (ECF subfamily)